MIHTAFKYQQDLGVKLVFICEKIVQLPLKSHWTLIHYMLLTLYANMSVQLCKFIQKKLSPVFMLFNFAYLLSVRVLIKHKTP